MSRMFPTAKNHARRSMDSASHARTTSRDRKANRKWGWVKQLLTAITPVAVAFIAIVPQLRRGDANLIKDLQARAFSSQQPANPALPIVPTEKLQSVSGILKGANGKPLLNGLEVSFVPPGLTVKTDVDDGSFHVPAMPALPAGVYSMIIRNSQGKSGRVNMVLPMDERDLREFQAKMKYQIEQLR